MGWYMFRFTRTNKDYTFIVVTCGYTETYDLIYHYHCLQNEPDKHLAKHVQVCYIYIEKKKSRDISKIVDFIKKEILLRLHLTGNEMDGGNEWSL